MDNHPECKHCHEEMVIVMTKITGEYVYNAVCGCYDSGPSISPDDAIECWMSWHNEESEADRDK